MVWLVGTASWTDKTLLDSGRFYPESVKTPEARLRFYASQLNLVEVDTTYYAIPAVTTAQHWVERTPPSFVFNVKAFSLFTGQGTNTDVLPKDLRQALGPGGLQGHPRGSAQRAVAAVCRLSGTSEDQRQARPGAFPVRTQGGAASGWLRAGSRVPHMAPDAEGFPSVMAGG